MSEVNPASYLQTRADHTAEQTRMVTRDVMGRSQGVAGASHMAVTANGTPNMSVNVAAGSFFVVGTESVFQGSYHGILDATTNVPIDTSDSQDRHDIVGARVLDSFYSGGDSEWVLDVVKGTPAGSPVDPTLPDNFLPLARVLVVGSASTITSGNITDLRPQAYAAGGVARVVSSRRPGATYGPGPAEPGTMIYELDTGLLKVWNGSTWEPFQNKLLLGYAQRTTDTSATSGTTVLDVGVTVTLQEAEIRDRALRITAGYGHTSGTIQTDAYAFQIRHGSSHPGTLLNQIVQVGPGASLDGATVVARHVHGSSPGNVTYRLGFARISGSSTRNIEATSTMPCYLMVEDMGPA